MTDLDKEADVDAQPDGVSPRRRLLNFHHVGPALGAVIVELVFVVVCGNQWVVNHVVVPWEASASPLRQGLAPGLGAFGWSVTPVLHGYYWIWAGGIVHVLAWLGATFLLVRISLRTPDMGARFVACAGSVVIAAIVALVAQRLVVYPDLSRLQEAATRTHQPGPGLIPWLFFGTIPGGSVMLVVIVGALAAITSGRLAIPGDRDDEGAGAGTGQAA
jgi:hypothetical protein